jgi:hypothetical protein
MLPTTESYIHQQVPYGVEKFNDIIHMKRSLTTRLYNLNLVPRDFPLGEQRPWWTLVT